MWACVLLCAMMSPISALLLSPQSPTNTINPHHRLLELQGKTNTTCAPLCWQDYDDLFDLRQWYRLDGCDQFNITRTSKRYPKLNGWIAQKVDSKGTYTYHNAWEDIAQGDSTYGFQSWRRRWTWNVALTEIIQTQIYQSNALPDPNNPTFETLMFTSTVYKINNDSTVAKTTLETMQLISFAGSTVQTVDQTTDYLKRIPTTDGCNNIL